jgi:hypothetical protein
MEYRVTFKGMLSLALVISILALAIIRIRFKVIVDEKQIEYTGFFATKVILFSDIVHSGWMFEHGYSRDRFYGSLVYEILSKNNRIKINFRLFPLGSMSKAIEMLENLRDKSTMADG